jgi:hypothetical protein
MRERRNYTHLRSQIVVCIVAKTNLKGKVYLFTSLMDAIDFIVCWDRKASNDFG